MPKTIETYSTLEEFFNVYFKWLNIIEKKEPFKENDLMACYTKLYIKDDLYGIWTRFYVNSMTVQYFLTKLN